MLFLTFRRALEHFSSLRKKSKYFRHKNKYNYTCLTVYILYIYSQGSDRIDSIWFANFWFAEVNQKSQKDFDSRCESKSFFFWFTWANHFIFRFWFILIHFRSERIVVIHFDSLWFLFLLILICDSRLFHSFWFSLTLIRRESWFIRESWFTCEAKSNRIKNQR